MIVRSRPGLSDILFAVRGSTVPKITGRIALLAAISVGAELLVQAFPGSTGRLSGMPFTLIGPELSLSKTALPSRWGKGSLEKSKPLFLDLV
jgi:putative membrane protein